MPLSIRDLIVGIIGRGSIVTVPGPGLLPGAGPQPPGFLGNVDKRYGSPIPLLFGRAKVKPQIVYRKDLGNLWRGNWWDGGQWKQAVCGASDQLLVLCEAPVSSVPICWKRFPDGALLPIDSASFAARLVVNFPSAGSVEVVTGTTPAAWAAYAGTGAAGMAHQGTVQVRLTKAVMPVTYQSLDLEFEVQGSSCVTASSTPNADPADMLVFLLTDTTHGLGFSTSLVDVELGVDGVAASSYRRYVNTRGWYISLMITEGESILDIIGRLLIITNSTLVWIDGKLKAVPLDDEAGASGQDGWNPAGSFVYTPVTSSTPIGDADFVGGRKDPVKVKRLPRSLVESVYPVDYTLRKDEGGGIVNYVTNHAEIQSDVWTATNNLRRAEAIDLTRWVLSETHAIWLAYCISQRAIYHRTRYVFKVKPRYVLVAPGDFIDLSDSVLGIAGVSCRVETAEESEDGDIELTTLEWPRATTGSFNKIPTSPAGVSYQRVVGLLASANLSNVDAGSVGAQHLQALADRDNLWPNPSSELVPPDNVDLTQPEWADRYYAHPGYSGDWVRQITSGVSGFWMPCSPGAQFYAEAQAKRTAGAGSGGRLNVGFYPTLGSFSGGLGLTSGAYSTSGSWAKVAVALTDAAPAGTNAAYISYEAASGDTVQFDALLARRVMQPETISSETISVTMGTGWTQTWAFLRRTGGLVCGSVWGQAGATSAWSSIFTLPVGARPITDLNVMGRVYDSSTGTVYSAVFSISASTGVVSLLEYDNGTANVPPFAIGNLDGAWPHSFVFPWI